MNICKTIVCFIVVCASAISVCAQNTGIFVNKITLEDGSTITWIQDNGGEMINPRSLFPTAPDEVINTLKLQNGMPASISTYILQTGGKTILFDTGLGNMGHGFLVERLKSIDINPEDVDYIYLTHLHPDHIGGMVNGNEVVFKNAQIFVGRVEYDAWMSMPAEQNKLQVGVLKAYEGKVIKFEFGDALPFGILPINAVGHTPGHTAFQKSNLIIIGDLIHGFALQNEYPQYNSKYDMNQEQSIQSRKRILEYAHSNNLIIAGMHLPPQGFVKQ